MVVEFSRGSVVTIGKGGKGVRRLGVVLQADFLAGLPSVMVCPLTTDEVDAPLLRVRLDPSDTLPLQSVSWIMVELLTAIPRSTIGTVLGHITSEQQRALDRGIIVVAGIS